MIAYCSYLEDLEHVVFGNLRALGIKQYEFGRGNSLAVVMIQSTDSGLLGHLAKMIAGETLKSAALVKKPLEPGDFWIAAEWWGNFLIEESLLKDHSGFLNTSKTEIDKVPAGGRSFLVLNPDQIAQAAYEDGEAAWTQQVSRAAVKENPRRFYGDLVDDKIGGAHALFAAGQEAAKARGLDSEEVIVGTPEIFGFARDVSECSVCHWRRKNIIDVSAVGFQLKNPVAAQELAEKHNVDFDARALQEKIVQWRDADIAYGVAIILVGLEDPPVVIPMGSVYQQPTMGTQIQNIATAEGANVMVPAGATVPVVLPAYCLNSSFLPPNGPVAPTPLVYTGAKGTQHGVWAEIEKRYRGET